MGMGLVIDTNENRSSKEARASYTSYRLQMID